MLGGTRSLLDRANDFSRYSDSELIAELGRLADELGIKMTFTIATDEKWDCQLDTLLASAFLTEVACLNSKARNNPAPTNCPCVQVPRGTYPAT